MDLLHPIARSRGLARVIEGLAMTGEGRVPRVRVGGLWGGSCAYFAAGLLNQLPAGVLIVTSSVETADELASDFRLFSDAAVMRFPAWDILPEEEDLVNHEVFGERLNVLRTLLFERDEDMTFAGDEAEATPPRPAEAMITSIQALLQPVLPPEDLLASSLEFRIGEELQPEELAELLVEQGFERCDVAELPGEFAMRGGIVDIFPFGTRRPLRLEFFDDRVESIREYDPGTQRSLRRLERARILAIAGDAYRGIGGGGERPSFLVYVPRDWVVLLVEPVEVQERAERAIAAEGDTSRLFSLER